MSCPKKRRKRQKIVKSLSKLRANSQMSCLILKAIPLKNDMFCLKRRKILAPPCYALKTPPWHRNPPLAQKPPLGTETPPRRMCGPSYFSYLVVISVLFFILSQLAFRYRVGSFYLNHTPTRNYAGPQKITQELTFIYFEVGMSFYGLE